MGKRVYIVSAGESLKGFDFSQLAKYETIAVNSVIRFVPECRQVVALDREFFENEAEFLKTYKGIIHVVDGYCEYPEGYKLTRWQFRKFVGLDTTPFVVHGFNSTHTAINIAINKGFNDIRLLGFDLGDDYFYGPNIGNEVTYNHMIEKCRIIRKQLPTGFKITNYSINSKADAFERKDLKYWQE